MSIMRMTVLLTSTSSRERLWRIRYAEKLVFDVTTITDTPSYHEPTIWLFSDVDVR